MVAPVAPLIERTGEAYAYPLLIKQLLHAPLSHSAEQQIVYRDTRRISYREFHQRIQRLAEALWRAGRDCRRHGGDDGLGQPPLPRSLLRGADDGRHADDGERAPVARADPVHAAALRRQGRAGQRRVRAVLQGLRAELPDVQALVLINDEATAPTTTLRFAGEYEALLDAAPAAFDFPDFDENTRATIFYTTGTTGLPKGVSFSHRQLVLHTLAVMAFFAASAPGQCFRRDDVYMPITPMFHVHAGACRTWPRRWV